MPIPPPTSLKLPRRPAPRAYAALPLVWATVVLVLTLTPAREMPRTPVWELLSFDTAAHAGVFFVLAGLSWFSLRRQRRWPRLARHAGVVVLAGSLLFGALIELLQMTMRLGRHGEWSDLLSDGLGAALAVGITTVGTRRWGRSHGLAVLGCGAGLLAVGSAQAQDLPRARATIETLASPELHGRGYVQQGEHLAAAYLRGRLHESGLAPLAPDYTQPFTLDVNTFPGQISLVIGDSVGLPNRPVTARTNFRAGEEFIAAADSRASAAGDPAWRQLLELPDSAALAASAWQLRLQTFPLRRYALLLRPADLRRIAALPLRARQHCDSAAWLTLVPKLTASLAARQSPNVRLELLDAAWRKKYVSRPHAAVPRTPFVQFGLAARLRRNYPTQNLAAIVRGTTQPDSFLVISAHYDHLGMMGRHVYFPGANDNASGVALLLELAAYYARPENRPACSVVFLLFGAEEAGLVGSQYFVAHPLVPLPRIKFLMNLDLLGTGEKGATVVNGRIYESAFRHLTALNDAHHYLPALGARGRAANSDHYPFSEAGVPAFFLYTRGGSTAYHDVNDRPEALSLVGFAGAFGLMRDFINELGAAPASR